MKYEKEQQFQKRNLVAISELTLRRAQKMLDDYAEAKVPGHIRDEIQILHRKRGNAIVLYERRPHWQDPSQHTEMPVARFVYAPEDDTWSLQYADRNDRWHLFEGMCGVRDFSELLAEVEADHTAIFWG
jgi:DUF3024 family protein